MEKFSIKDVGVKVGLEIHQQLDTRKNYFVIVLLSNQMITQ
jgi:glutamyl-tRNA(Gln) amidotransferase subunit E (EC 6.3.5.7)